MERRNVQNAWRLRRVAMIIDRGRIRAIAVVLATPVLAFGGQGKPQIVEPGGVPQVAMARADRSGSPEIERPVLQRRGWRYQLRPGDILEVSFPFTPEFNQTVTVQPDGYITLRGLSDFHVAGQTKPELTRALQTAFAKILHEPVITVDLKDFNKPYFIAGGEVARPGKYELRGDATVTEAVAMAGGFNGQAKHSQVVLFRRASDDTVEARVLDVKQMLKNRTLGEDIHLKPGDLLFVPQNTISKIRRYMPIPNLSMYWNPAQF